MRTQFMVFGMYIAAMVGAETKYTALMWSGGDQAACPEQLTNRCVIVTRNMNKGVRRE